MKAYLDFEVTVNVVDGDRYMLSVSGPGGEATGVLDSLHLNPSYREQAERLRLLDTDEVLLTNLGQMLFEAVFRGSIKDVYTRTQGLLGPDQGMRLRLVIPSEAGQVAALPWEFLYDPDQGPLALLDAPVVRYLPQQDRQLTQAAPLPLKVLLTGAQTGAPAAVERELEEVQQALTLLGDRVEVTVEPHLTLPKLQQLLRSGFHIWHFAGHGAFARDGKTGQLILEDANGDAAPVSSVQLGIMLNRSGLKLVVLDACSSAELTVDSLRSVAPAIIRAQVPAVVAMQFKVPEEATRAFATEFYRTLANGVPIDACVTEGRKAVMGVAGLGSPEWGIPVIYTRALDGRLFAPEDTPAPPPLPAAAEPVPANGRTIGAGMHALGDLLDSAPQLREAIISFRTDFLAASTQIEQLSVYKDIHDQLHALQFHCFNLVSQETRRASADQIAWEVLTDSELTLQSIRERLRDIAVRAELPEAEITWIGDLEQAQGELHISVEQLDLPRLKKSARLINRILTLQPTQINARLTAAARALRIESLTRNLTMLRDSLTTTPLDTDKTQPVIEGLIGMVTLSNTLTPLVVSHDTWQMIDMELRRIETTVEIDTTELELSWEDLHERISKLSENSSEASFNALLTDGVRLTEALGAADTTKIRHFFRRYRRQVGDRFYRLDIDLKRTCDELRVAGEPLVSLLRALG